VVIVLQKHPKQVDFYIQVSLQLPLNLHVKKFVLNNLKIAHGGYIFGLADTAAGIAAMTNGGNVVTVNSNINYISPAKGNKIKAIASSIKNGKIISVYEVKIYDEKDKLISTATISFYNIENKNS
jgi:acyl-CoA thioesterase